MRIKLDENIPVELTRALRARGDDVDTVLDEDMQGKADPAVWEAAQSHARFLITQDLDFSDVRSFPPGTHHGVLLVRLGSPSRRALVQRIDAVFAGEDVDSWAKAFVVLTETKLRVRRRS